MADEEFRSFTALQYYLAHSENNVHTIFELEHPIDNASFETLVETVIGLAPQLLWRESLIDGGHYCDKTADWSSRLTFEHCGTRYDADRALHMHLGKSLQDDGLPAFRAICQSFGSPPDQRRVGRLIVQTTHALVEGGDVSAILEGRGSQHDTRPIVSSGLSVLSQLGVRALVPFLLPMHLLTAKLQRKRASDFDFARLVLGRVDLRKAARRLGVGQKDLTFALTTYGYSAAKNNKKHLLITYSTLPKVRAALSDDEFLNLRMDELRLSVKCDPEDHIKAVADALSERGANPIFVQTWQRLLTRAHQRLHRLFPWLYPQSFFGFAPYDLVLSMIPPVRPAALTPLLKRALVFGGTNTGSAAACIFVPTAEYLTLTIWGDDSRDRQVSAIIDVAQSLGIEARRYGEAPCNGNCAAE